MPLSTKDRQRQDLLLAEAFLSTNENVNGQRMITIIERDNAEPTLVEVFMPDDIPPNHQGQRAVCFMKRTSPSEIADVISRSIKVVEKTISYGVDVEAWYFYGAMEQMYEYLSNASSY